MSERFRPRVDPAAPDDLDDEVAALVRLAAGTDGKPLRVVATLARRPELVGPFLAWSAALAGPGALTGRAHELVALRTAWRNRSDYEWGHHVEYARRNSVTEAEIDRVAVNALDEWTDGDRALLAVVDAMCTDGVDDATWAVARELHGDVALVELVWTVGQYASLSLITDTLRVDPEPGLDRCPPTVD